ncbi:MAG: hypothetical protein SCK28_01500 [Bacillota bacterium]|nr:hypothetical protein [Bacillota bacterium]
MPISRKKTRNLEDKRKQHKSREHLDKLSKEHEIKASLTLELHGLFLPRECLELVARLYNFPGQSSRAKEFIRFELKRILGNDYDITGFLNNPNYKHSK